jgi:hypothetical protein
MTFVARKHVTRCASCTLKFLLTRGAMGAAEKQIQSESRASSDKYASINHRLLDTLTIVWGVIGDAEPSRKAPYSKAW